MAQTPPPFIIWTLQRTGGTNLTQRLLERSGLASTQHEPFNIGRVYGDITKKWMETKDDAELARSTRGIAAKRAVIKHCVEMVPWEVTRALADATVQAGYRHLFLYRVNALDRLLSLHFAQKTGVWGPNMKKNALLDESLAEPIPQDRLTKHEEDCVSRLSQTWHYLLSQGHRPVALSYEEIYRTSPGLAAGSLQPVLEALGLSRDKYDDRAFAMEVIGKGDQGTRDKYGAIPGVRELEQALKKIACFEPGPREALCGAAKPELPAWIINAKIDSLPTTLLEGQQFDFGGVVVLGADAPEEVSLHLMAGKEELGVQWGIASQKMAKLYPASPQSANARFKTAPLFFSNKQTFKLFLSDGFGNRFPLFEIPSAK